jgi:TonB family protein
MFFLAFRSVAFVSCLLGALSGGPAFPPLLYAAPPPDAAQQAPPGKRWVTFDFAGLDASGDIRIGNPLKLSLTLNGAAHSHTPLVAICESLYFERQIVAMEPGSRAMEMRATAILEPIAPGKLSVTPKVARIRVTFARAVTDKKLERVMTRIVYVTLGTHAPESEPDDRPPSSLDDLGEADANDHDMSSDATPIATPIADESLVEEDLLPLPTPGPGQVYWQNVSSLLSRSWSHAARRVRHAPSSETVHVRFRMYPSGRAQLIQIEKGSGAREIDEAGIHAVVHAQPFPPFPEGIASEPIEVHVRMQTGARAGARGIRPASIPQAPQQSASTLTPKK